MPTRPVVCVVVLVHPQQNVHVTLFGAEHDPAVLLVYAYGPEVRVAGIVDLFIVDPGALGVVPKFGYELHDLFLLRLGYHCKGLQESVADCNFDLMHRSCLP